MEGNGVGSFNGDVVGLCVGLIDGCLVGTGVVGEDVGYFVGLSLGDDVDPLGLFGLCENGSKIKRIGE